MKDQQTLPATHRGHRFLELDSLRGLAAFAVVLGHFRGGLATSPPQTFLVISRLFGSGHAAVVLFFLLSGFVLTGPYLQPQWPAYTAFLIKRICRIWLPYIAAIVLSAGFAAKLYSTTKTGNPWIDQTWSKPFSARLLLQHLLMVGHYDDVQLNTAIWSLVIEMRISIAFPAIVWLTTKHRPASLLAACLPATLALGYLSNRYGHGMLCDTLFYGMMFLVGSLLRRHHEVLSRVVTRGPIAPAALLALGILCYQAGESVPFAKLGAASPQAIYLSDWVIALGGLLILTLSIAYAPLRHLLHGRSVMWLGTRSYSIYLLHGTVLFTLIRLHWMNNFSMAMLSIYLFAVLGAAEIFHRLIEVPSMTLGRRFGSKNPPSHLHSEPPPSWALHRTQGYPEA